MTSTVQIAYKVPNSLIINIVGIDIPLLHNEMKNKEFISAI